MKPKAFQTLTWAVFNLFCNRKEVGKIDVVVDTETKLIYPVPLDEEHKTFTPKIIGLTTEDIRANPERFMRLVPSTIATQFDEAIGVRTGVSGLELGMRVRHTRQQLELAHGMALAFVEYGEVPKSREYKDWGIEYKFAVA